MKVTSLQVGLYGTNCYIAWDEATLNAAVIDPGDQADDLLKLLERQGLTAKLILLTHGHFDHTGAVEPLRAATGAQVWIHRLDLEQGPMGRHTLDLSKEYHFYDEGDTVTLDSLTFRVLATPGHTPGSVCLVCGDCLFAGDTLFAGSCGRTDFAGGSWADMEQSLKRLYTLQGDYRVLPGHMDPSTLDRERKTNPFMAQALQDL